MSEVALAPLSSLWSALAPRRAEPAPPPDVGAIAAAAEAQGRAAGRAEAEAELVPLRKALTSAAAALDAAVTIDPVALQPLFAELVTAICAAVVDAELRLSPTIVERLVGEALASIETDGDTVLRVSPRDAALLPPALKAVPDPELADGEVRVETAQHVVAASLAARLAGIVEALA